MCKKSLLYSKKELATCIQVFYYGTNLPSVVGFRAPPLREHRQHSASTTLPVQRAHIHGTGVADIIP